MADFDAYVKCQERVSEVFQVSFKLKFEPAKLHILTCNTTLAISEKTERP